MVTICIPMPNTKQSHEMNTRFWKKAGSMNQSMLCNPVTGDRLKINAFKKAESFGVTTQSLPRDYSSHLRFYGLELRWSWARPQSSINTTNHSTELQLWLKPLYGFLQHFLWVCPLCYLPSSTSLSSGTDRIAAHSSMTAGSVLTNNTKITCTIKYIKTLSALANHLHLN